MSNLGEQGMCSKCGHAYLSDNHSIKCLSSQSSQLQYTDDDSSKSGQQSFSDADLKQLKENIKDKLYVTVGDDEYGDPNEVDLKALLARLEAAEAVIECEQLCDKHEDLKKAWRKVCSRE